MQLYTFERESEIWEKAHLLKKKTKKQNRKSFGIRQGYI